MGLPPRFEKVLKILKPLQLSAYDVSYTLPPPPAAFPLREGAL